MVEPHGVKIMIDLHGLSVQQVKKLLEEKFAKIKSQNIGELYLITGVGNHVNANGTRGVLKKILPKLLKPYCQDILKINPDIGAYKIILKPKQELTDLQQSLMRLFVEEGAGIEYASILQQKAEENDIESILALAVIHLHQAIKGFDSVDEGIALLMKAKKLGSLEADVQLGILYHEGLIVKQHHKKAFKHFLYAAKEDHPVAQYYVAVCYLQGKGVKYDDKQAVSWMKKSADQNDAYAQDALGDFYLMGELTKQDMLNGIAYKKKAAEQGIVDAQIDLGRCYATGHGVVQDYQIAYRYYLAAAQFNKPYAIYQVGSYLFTGRTGLAPDPTTAFDWYLKAAELDDADGQAQVAYQYLFGIGIAQNLEKGKEWAFKAVQQKNAYGYYVIAQAHLKGLGIEQDVLKAYNYMKLAAVAGYEDAQYELGILLFVGKKIFSKLPSDFEEGMQWLEKAADRGNEYAAQTIELFFENARNPAALYMLLHERMQELLAPGIISIKSNASPAVSSGGNLDHSHISQEKSSDISQNSSLPENKASSAATVIANSSSIAFFKPAQSVAEPLEDDVELESHAPSGPWGWCSII